MSVIPFPIKPASEAGLLKLYRGIPLQPDAETISRELTDWYARASKRHPPEVLVSLLEAALANARRRLR